MTEITTAATTKRAASSFDLAGHPIPKFDLPNMEMPKAFHEMTEMGVAHAKDTYAKAKVATEEVADLLQNTYATLAKGANDYNLKLFEIVRVNSRSAFDYAQGLLGVKSPFEFIERSTAQMRQQFAMFSAHNKELSALAQEVATRAAVPIKAGVSKAFNKAS
jgi:phasin